MSGHGRIGEVGTHLVRRADTRTGSRRRGRDLHTYGSALSLGRLTRRVPVVDVNMGRASWLARDLITSSLRH